MDNTIKMLLHNEKSISKKKRWTQRVVKTFTECRNKTVEIMGRNKTVIFLIRSDGADASSVFLQAQGASVAPIKRSRDRFIPAHPVLQPVFLL